MTLIKNAELWHVRCVPDRPNKRFNPEQPTWELQIRTYDKAQAKEWEGQGVKLKPVIPDDDAPPFWKANLRKKITKKDGTASDPVEVTGGNLRPVDPAIIGNGSKGNVRLYQYEYKKATGGTDLGNILMGVQITTLKKYTPKPRDDDFEEEEMTIIEEDVDDEVEIEDEELEIEDEEEVEEEEAEEEEAATPTPKPKTPAPKVSTKKFD